MRVIATTLEEYAHVPLPAAKEKTAITRNAATCDSKSRDYGTLTEAGVEKALSPLCESTAVTA